MTPENITEYRALTDAGFKLTKHPGIRFNSGSETIEHAMGKLCAAFVCRESGYTVDSEVSKFSSAGIHQGDVDLLCYDHPSRQPIIVEIHTEPDEFTWDVKWQQYQADVIREMYLIDIDDLTQDVYTDTDYIRRELGL